ncbi:DUF819 family protein [bacterium]|nr:DUF819 family protein [bacterium]
MDALVTSPAGVVAALAAVAAFFFLLEKKTQWKLFNFLPPLIFIYVVPVILSNTGVIPQKSGVYDFMGDNILPVFLVVMLLEVDLLATIRVMGKGLFVMLLGTLGVVIGAPIAYFIVKSGLEPEMWKGFGALAGSWIGGTANMAAVAQSINLSDSSLAFGYGVIADNMVYLIWLPIMLGSKNFAEKFHRFTKVDPNRLKNMEAAAERLTKDKGPVEMRHLLYLIFLGFAGAAAAKWLAGHIPEVQPYLSTSTYTVFIVTLIGIGLSFTRASRIPGSHIFAMALIYLFVARMGARADLSNLSMSVFWFLLGAYIWIFIHGAFLLAAARIFRVDVHTAAISSAANIGGAASAPIVAAYHKPTLVPVSILMAMVGYAIGNYAAWVAAQLCRIVSTI